MTATTDVFLITGFLGSGKTTFLNRIIKRFPQDKKLTILMNEFGEVGIDGTLVEGDDIDMLEISRGSIFCVCVKTDFIKGLYELNTKVKPDVLIIESTGVANPTDLKRDLKLPIFNDRFQFKEQFCLVDAVHFLEAFDTFASIEKQLATSTIFIINKIDLASREEIDRVREKIAGYHPEPKFFETRFSEIPMESFSFSRKAGDTPCVSEGEKMRDLSADELESFIDDLLDQPDGEISPPDQLVSVSYQWTGEDLAEVKHLAEHLPDGVVRAKGFIGKKGHMQLFSYVMGTWTIEPVPVAEAKIPHPNAVVFIGSMESMAGIAEATATGHWTSRAVLQPIQGISR
jgi:G3E family GTPase